MSSATHYGPHAPIPQRSVNDINRKGALARWRWRRVLAVAEPVAQCPLLHVDSPAPSPYGNPALALSRGSLASEWTTTVGPTRVLSLSSSHRSWHAQQRQLDCSPDAQLRNATVAHRLLYTPPLWYVQHSAALAWLRRCGSRDLCTALLLGLHSL